MKIIFSPSKEMREENIFENKKIEFTESPFKDKTNILIDVLKQKSIEEIESIMKLKADLLTKTKELAPLLPQPYAHQSYHEL